MINLRWFNASPPWFRGVRPFNLFNRVCADGSLYFGAGLLQIGTRHLFYVGRIVEDGRTRYPLALGFVWLTEMH